MRRCRPLIVAWMLAQSGLAGAADAAAEEPAVTPSAEPQRVPAALSEAQPAPFAPSAEREPAAPPTDAELPTVRPNADEKWPLESVRRPLTLPAKMGSVVFEMGAFRPNHLVNGDPTTGTTYTFHPSVSAGAGFALGLTDRTQVAASVPRILCFNSEAPSACSDFNRYNGSAATLRYLALRGSYTQLAPYLRISVSNSSPFVYRWWAGGTVKITAFDTAFTVSASVAHDIDPPPRQQLNPWLAYLPIGLNLQIVQRVVIYGVVEPWGALDHLGRGIALELYGGAAYTFSRRGEVVLEGGIYNVLSQPEWNRAVPGSFAELALVFWTY